MLNQSSPTKRANAKGIDQIKAAIKAQQTAEFEERGLSARTVRSPSKTSLRNYHTLAATEPGVSLTKSTIHKTEKRFAAETSLRSTAAYLATVIANHFVPCEDAESEIPKDIGPGAKELHSIVNKFFKVPMCALKPQYVTSTDDTAVFAMEGIIKDGQNEWKRVSSSAAKHSERASRSIFTTEETKDSFICNGLRIKLTFTFSAAGTMAPLVMRITRLSESELPVSTCPMVFSWSPSK